MSINYEEYIADLIAKGHAAQEIANGYDQAMVEKLTAAVAYQLTKPEVALKFGEMLVEESGMGVAKDKQLKMYGKVKGAYFQMKGKTSVGLYAVDAVSYTHLRAHETDSYLVCRLLLEK